MVLVFFSGRGCAMLCYLATLVVDCLHKVIHIQREHIFVVAAYSWASGFGNDSQASYKEFSDQGILSDSQVLYSCADLVQFHTHMLPEGLEEVNQ